MDLVDLEALNEWLGRRHGPEFGLPYWHGWLTSLICAPHLIRPSEWMRSLVGMDDDAAPLLTAEEMERVTGLIMDLYNETCEQALGTRFRPRLSSAPNGLVFWCRGFMDGFGDWVDDIRKEEWPDVTWLIMPMMILAGRERFLKSLDKAPDEETLRRIEETAPDNLRSNVPLLRKLFMETRGPD